jgi:hypothetical protein
MNVNEWNDRYQLVKILTGLTIAGLRGLRLTEELSELLRSEKWRHSTPNEKHKLLDAQYERDYLAAEPEQRELIKRTRAMIEAQLKVAS